MNPQPGLDLHPNTFIKRCLCQQPRPNKNTSRFHSRGKRRAPSPRSRVVRAGTAAGHGRTHPPKPRSAPLPASVPIPSHRGPGAPPRRPPRDTTRRLPQKSGPGAERGGATPPPPALPDGADRRQRSAERRARGGATGRASAAAAARGRQGAPPARGGAEEAGRARAATRGGPAMAGHPPRPRPRRSVRSAAGGPRRPGSGPLLVAEARRAPAVGAARPGCEPSLPTARARFSSAEINLREAASCKGNAARPHAGAGCSAARPTRPRAPVSSGRNVRVTRNGSERLTSTLQVLCQTASAAGSGPGG